MTQREIIAKAYLHFSSDVEAEPAISLRSGTAIDNYEPPVPFDKNIDLPNNAYILENAYFALPHLDPASWRHYLPRLIEYVLQNQKLSTAMVDEALLWSLRPPDREPPRLESLRKEQKEVVVAFLSFMAFETTSSIAGFARQILEEYWIDKSLDEQNESGPMRLTSNQITNDYVG